MSSSTSPAAASGSKKPSPSSSATSSTSTSLGSSSSPKQSSSTSKSKSKSKSFVKRSESKDGTIIENPEITSFLNRDTHTRTDTWKPRHVKIYRRELDAQIGEGTYGAVFLARAPNGERVALKKIRKQKEEGFPITAIREIKILKMLDHENIVRLKDVVSSHSHIDNREGNVFMVFEFCDHDLTGIMESGQRLSEGVTKYYLRCILQALYYCHKKKILHRDIKGANILVSNNGDVKLADFGLARETSMKGQYTNRVVTLWYRPPELLLGQNNYTDKIDMWSTGCLFAELLTGGTVLFPGNHTELDQLSKIYAICGTPSEEDWPEMKTLKMYDQFKPTDRPRVLKQHFSKQSRLAIDLLDKLLTLNPAKRLSAKDALDHEYFWTKPLPITASEHPRYNGNFHEFNTKRRKNKRNLSNKSSIATANTTNNCSNISTNSNTTNNDNTDSTSSTNNNNKNNTRVNGNGSTSVNSSGSGDRKKPSSGSIPSSSSSSFSSSSSSSSTSSSSSSLTRKQYHSNNSSSMNSHNNHNHIPNNTSSNSNDNNNNNNSNYKKSSNYHKIGKNTPNSHHHKSRSHTHTQHNTHHHGNQQLHNQQHNQQHNYKPQHGYGGHSQHMQHNTQHHSYQHSQHQRQHQHQNPQPHSYQHQNQNQSQHHQHHQHHHQQQQQQQQSHQHSSHVSAGSGRMHSSHASYGSRGGRGARGGRGRNMSGYMSQTSSHGGRSSSSSSLPSSSSSSSSSQYSTDGRNTKRQRR